MQRASYLQEEAALINGGAQRKALFPVIRVGGCRAADVLPGGLVVVHCRTQSNRPLFKSLLQYRIIQVEPLFDGGEINVCVADVANMVEDDFPGSISQDGNTRHSYISF